MKRFNVTGTCVGHKHYMVDISGKLDEIEKLIEAEHYFTINRARQYGKTTTLLHLERRLVASSEYLVASITFGNVGLSVFDTEENFCNMFLQKISDALAISGANEEYAKKWYQADVTCIGSLDRHLTKMCKNVKVVLMIDEVDKSSNNRLFLHFLGLLREKYLSRQGGKDYAFHSVILAGVTDIKNLKLKLINDGVYELLKDEGRVVNSPWNIAADFDVDMSFSIEDISTMLDNYEADNSTGMDVYAIASEIHYHTNGYPFLVSRICKHIDEKLGKIWTTEGVSQAVQIILSERSVLLDDFAKNLNNNGDLRNFLYELHILGEHKSFTLSNITIDLAHSFAYIKKGERSKAIISNRIFESYLTDYYIAKDENSPVTKRVPGVIYQDVIKDGKFDMAACLSKFAEHYKEIYASKDIEFHERHGRLLFLSYLTPLLNGQGRFYIESQFTDSRRMDVLVDFEKEQYIVELKIWRGEAAKEKAYEQLLGYMESKNALEGYLLTFDFRKHKTGEHSPNWVEIGGRRIFDVVV